MTSYIVYLSNHVYIYHVYIYIYIYIYIDNYGCLSQLASTSTNPIGPCSECKPSLALRGLGRPLGKPQGLRPTKLPLRLSNHVYIDI